MAYLARRSLEEALCIKKPRIGTLAPLIDSCHSSLTGCAGSRFDAAGSGLLHIAARLLVHISRQRLGPFMTQATPVLHFMFRHWSLVLFTYVL